VYDPNHPDDDGVSLILRLAPDRVEEPIQYVAGGHPVRGFFLTRYRRAHPAEALGGG
jgi:hypothetical protein